MNSFKIIMIIGNRGTGKTGTLIRKIVPEYIALRKGKFKIGVFDLENNYNYNHFECLTDPRFDEQRKKLLINRCENPVPIVSRDRFPNIKEGMVRILPGKNEHAAQFAKTCLSDIVYNQSVNNCLVVVEDTARFMPNNNALDSALHDLMINCKQRKMDLVMMFHFWSDVPPTLLKWIDVIYLHKCDESVKSREKKLSPIKVEKILQAEARVNKQPNRYHSEKIILQ